MWLYWGDKESPTYKSDFRRSQSSSLMPKDKRQPINPCCYSFKDSHIFPCLQEKLKDQCILQDYMSSIS